jgi:hypothetical protein
MAAPGTYTVRLTVGDSSYTAPLTLRADPRSLRDGMTPALYAAQLAHNLRARDLVSDVNHLVDRVRAARERLAASTAPAAADTLRRLATLERALVTPTVRYSQPALQTHVSYLYSAPLGADQPAGRDATERYAALRKQVSARMAEARAILGPE